MGTEGRLDQPWLPGRSSAAGESVRSDDGSTTIVLGLVRPGEVVVANVGDSRAYWLGDDGRRHSCSASTTPGGLTRSPPGSDRMPNRSYPMSPGWLRPTNGLLVLCSDGMWNYADAPDTLAGLVPRNHATEPFAMARGLVRSALAAAGADNVTVAVLAYQGPDDAEQ